MALEADLGEGMVSADGVVVRLAWAGNAAAESGVDGGFAPA
ncbi:hypothetical protein [Mycobacterium servetii]|uniref:Uncharacterized protein n=1 Tax=Mycobacterium servetii TaxID=3237418 RepID=A0ABV4C9S7_9MYCO